MIWFDHTTLYKRYSSTSAFPVNLSNCFIISVIKPSWTAFSVNLLNDCKNKKGHVWGKKNYSSGIKKFSSDDIIDNLSIENPDNTNGNTNLYYNKSMNVLMTLLFKIIIKITIMMIVKAPTPSIVIQKDIFKNTKIFSTKTYHKVEAVFKYQSTKK